jgi:molecular chaperone DnaK
MHTSLTTFYGNLAEIPNEAKESKTTPRVDIDGRLYTAQELSAMTLQKMKKLLKTI